MNAYRWFMYPDITLNLFDNVKYCLIHLLSLKDITRVLFNKFIIIETFYIYTLLTMLVIIGVFPTIQRNILNIGPASREYITTYISFLLNPKHHRAGVYFSHLYGVSHIGQYIQINSVVSLLFKVT